LFSLINVRDPHHVTPGWRLSLYPGAGEGGGCFVSGPRRHNVGVKGAAKDRDRALSEAARRARGKVRRYCAEHRLNRFGTLTYAEPFCTDPVELRRDVGEFFRSLRASLGGDPFPYLWVPELHADGERFHVHFAVGRYVGRRLIEQAWGRGFVHIKLIGNLSSTSTSWHEARVAARYLGKYVAKSFEGERQVPGLHRFEVAQGFQPSKMVLQAPSRDEIISDAIDVMGVHVGHVWSSEDQEGWAAPPALWISWDR
jgi:hypothetical protein